MDHGKKMPTQAEILEMIDGLTDISEEEKESLRRDILQGGTPEVAATGGSASPELAFVFVLFLIIAAVIGGIAIVLIRREKAREEERRKDKKKKAVKGKKAGKGK